MRMKNDFRAHAFDYFLKESPTRI